MDKGNRIREDIPHGQDTQNLRARIGSHTGAVPRRSRVGSRVQRITTLKSESLDLCVAHNIIHSSETKERNLIFIFYFNFNSSKQLKS